MPTRRRLDAELVRRGLARSRQHAQELIEGGQVSVGGMRAGKSATQVETSAALVVAALDGEPDFASRGAHKLLGALDAFPIEVGGRRCLDAGASTGGFTDVLLRRGAHQVVAVDVGYGQLIWRLQSDDRVTVLDRTNIRNLNPEDIAPAPTIAVADLSFISLTLVLEPIARCLAPGSDLVLMVKPQFEVGRARLGAGGVVRNSEHRRDAVVTVATAAMTLGLTVHGVQASPLPGPSGNVEYFLWLRTAGASEPPAWPALLSDEMQAAVESAVERGPMGDR